jgi:hypothetical protein
MALNILTLNIIYLIVTLSINDIKCIVAFSLTLSINSTGHSNTQHNILNCYT